MRVLKTVSRSTRLPRAPSKDCGLFLQANAIWEILDKQLFSVRCGQFLPWPNKHLLITYKCQTLPSAMYRPAQGSPASLTQQLLLCYLKRPPLVGPFRLSTACCSSVMFRRRTTSARADLSSWMSSSCIWTRCSREAMRSVTSMLLAAEALSSKPEERNQWVWSVPLRKWPRKHTLACGSNAVIKPQRQQFFRRNRVGSLTT